MATPSSRPPIPTGPAPSGALPTAGTEPVDEMAPDSLPVAVASRSWWHRIGGGSLSISIVIHAIVILLCILIYFKYTIPGKEDIDFLPGGGGGGSGAEAKVAQKKRAANMSAPKTRIVSAATSSSVTLPDITTSMSDFSSLTKATPMGGGMGGGKGGLRGSGEGGMMGNGRGTGVGPGFGKGFISLPLFGQKIDARRMAVVLDVSNSMHSFLPIVIKEVDKIAPGSPVILHFGCGLSDAEVNESRVEPTTERTFESDRMFTSVANSKSMNAQEQEELIKMFTKRPKTYFVPTTGIGTTWIALLDTKLKDCDAIYWFADFADALGEARIEEISKKLKTRKQKLYIHPSNPRWLVAGDRLATNVARVEAELVTPSGGKVINADVKKDGAVKGNAPKKKPGA